MSVVIDCSALVDLFLDPNSVEAALVAESEWVAPSTLDVEFVAVLRGLVQAKVISAAEMDSFIGDYHQLAIRIYPLTLALQRRMAQLKDSFSACDASYVALAEQLGAVLATRDLRLRKEAARLVPVLDW